MLIFIWTKKFIALPDSAGDDVADQTVSFWQIRGKV
jgi:hypothetical protein